MSATIINNVVYGPEECHIPAHLSFAQFIFDRLVTGGDKIALISAETGESITYNKILQYSVNLAASLQRLGLKKGDVVALSAENRFEFLITSFATAFCGAVLATVNITYTPGEITHVFNITKPKFIFVSPLTASNIEECSQGLSFLEKIITYGDFEVSTGALMYQDLVKELVDVRSFQLVDVNGLDDTFVILCSSGTTGLPKGVMITHVNILTLVSHFKYYLFIQTEQKNRVLKNSLSLIPWFHGYGFASLLALVSLHIEIVFLIRFEPEQYLETIQNHKINLTLIVPPLGVFLAKNPLVLKYDLSSLVEMWCGAAPLPIEIQKAISERTSVEVVKQGYGLTELTMACCIDHKGKLGCSGNPAPGMKVKVVDIETGKLLGPRQEGEICIKSPLRMKGYIGDPAATEASFDCEGFVKTGDIGYYDDEGDFYIVDRLKELIKYNGFQVAPAEIEALLLSHAAVAECGVVGAPHAAAGELPTAFVVPQPAARPTPGELQDFVASKLSSAKHLRGGVIFIEEIPKNASGKILRRELKKLLKPSSKL